VVELERKNKFVEKVLRSFFNRDKVIHELNFVDFRINFSGAYDITKNIYMKYNKRIQTKYYSRFISVSNTVQVPMKFNITDAVVWDMFQFCVRYQIHKFHQLHFTVGILNLKCLTILVQLHRLYIMKCRMIVNKELERMWKKTAIACFKIPSYHLPGGSQGD
jgi:hypothetical protein